MERKNQDNDVDYNGIINMPKNKENSTEWFRDAGFGLFICWSPESQIGAEQSWPLVGASKEFRDKFYALYRTFNPTKFNPKKWARLAKYAGMKYVVFTTQHFAGFSMFDTNFSNYNIMNTPYGKDITARIADAFRNEGIAIGWYYGVENWYYYYKTGAPEEIYSHYNGNIDLKKYKKPFGPQNKTLLEYELGQMKELLTKYDDIDIMWFDQSSKAAKPLKELCWKLKPNIFIVRSEIPTPEQKFFEKIVREAWESCMTMGTSWGYKPNDRYKSAKEIINNLVKIRANGGNYLLSVGPNSDGEIPLPEVEILEDLGYWNMINGEAIHEVRSWIINHEGDIWFTKKKNEETVYAFLTSSWRLGEDKTFILKSVEATKNTFITVLGQSPEESNCKWHQDKRGFLHITAVKKRYGFGLSSDWPSVIKITHATKRKFF